MIDLIHDIFNIAGRYGLKVINIDATDVTLHKPIKERLNIEAFVVRCLNILKDKGVL